jgi:hypothetical protein
MEVMQLLLQTLSLLEPLLEVVDLHKLVDHQIQALLELAEMELLTQ